MNSLSFDLQSLDADAWHAILTLFDDASIDQTWIYAAARWPRVRRWHFVMRRAGDVVAAAQAVLWRLPLVGTSFGHVKFGPLWRRHGAAPDPDHLAQALQGLRHEFVEKRGALLRLSPRAEPEATGITPLLEREGFHPAAQDPHPERYLVDLVPSLETLEAGLRTSWRRHLYRARRHRLTVVEAHGAQAAVRFLPIYEEMLARKGFHDTSGVGTLYDLCTRLPDGLRPRVFLLHEGQDDIAGAVVTLLGDTAMYLFGAMRDRARALDAGYFLHWAVIAWLKTHAPRCHWYDLGGDCGDPGLRQFKSGLVGRHGRLVPLPGNFDGCAPGASALAINGVLRARELWSRLRARRPAARG